MYVPVKCYWSLRFLEPSHLCLFWVFDNLKTHSTLSIIINFLFLVLSLLDSLSYFYAMFWNILVNMNGTLFQGKSFLFNSTVDYLFKAELDAILRLQVTGGLSDKCNSNGAVSEGTIWKVGAHEEKFLLKWSIFVHKKSFFGSTILTQVTSMYLLVWSDAIAL